MRIISQYSISFPYEQIVVMLDSNCIRGKVVSDMNGRYYLIGEYDTEERAREVFNEIHDNYARLGLGSMVFAMPEE